MLPLFSAHFHIVKCESGCIFTEGQEGEVGPKKRTHFFLPSSRRLSGRKLTLSTRVSHPSVTRVPRSFMATSASPPNPPRAACLNPATPTCIIDGLVMAALKHDSNVVDVLTTVGAGGRVRITRSRRGQLRLFTTAGRRTDFRATWPHGGTTKRDFSADCRGFERGLAPCRL